MSPYASYLLQTVVTLAGVCGFAALLLYAARRAGMGRPSGGLELLGRLPLDARRSVVLVKIGDTVFVIGTGDGAMTKLGELPASSVPIAVSQDPRPFASVLSRVMGKAPSASGIGATKKVEPESTGETKP